MRPTRVSMGIAAALVATAALAATLVGSKGTFTTTVTPAADNSKRDNIDITYTPDPTKVTCNSIYLTQTCRDVDQNNTVIQPEDYKSDTFKHLQNDMTPGGTYVDHVVCEKDPYYNGEDKGKDTKSEGSSDGTTAKPTKMSDDPTTKDASFPDGVTKITSTFEVCAVCKDDGSILDCITWKWERTKGSAGKGTITDATAVGAASQEFKDAVKKYNENHKNSTVCPEEEAEKNKGQPNVTPGTNKKVPNDPPVEHVPSMVGWDIVNSSGVNVPNVQYIILLDGNPIANGFIPSIPYFDHATVNFSLPPLPHGPHVLQMILDPGNSIPEYNEEDNMLQDPFMVQPPTGGDPAIWIDNVAGLEGDAGQSDFDFTVRLSSPMSQAVRVDFATSDGTATTGGSNSDYIASSGTVTIPADSTSASLTIKVKGDTNDEGSAPEIFNVTLSNPSLGTIVDGAGQGAIIDDDPPRTGADNPPVTQFALGKARPNPARGVAVIDYAVPRQTHVRLTVVDLQGRQVAVLVDDIRAAGRYTAEWTGRGNAYGTYFYRLQAGNFIQTRKFSYLR